MRNINFEVNLNHFIILLFSTYSTDEPNLELESLLSLYIYILKLLLRGNRISINIFYYQIEDII